MILLLEDTMTAIYSSAALKTRQREIKDEAMKRVVHITENGNAAFVFCSEEVFESELRRAREAAAYEERMRAVLERGRADVVDGNTVEGTDAALAEIARRAAHRV